MKRILLYFIKAFLPAPVRPNHRALCNIFLGANCLAKSSANSNKYHLVLVGAIIITTITVRDNAFSKKYIFGNSAGYCFLSFLLNKI
jgi:hypothetical protein